MAHSHFRGGFMRIILTLVFVLALAGCGVQLKGSVAEQRNQIKAMETATLSQLYVKDPSARKNIRKAAGYGVFDASGGKIMFGGLDHGNGVIFDNASGRRTYMKMFELQPGLGFGYTNFRLVFVFDTREVMNDFINNGWEFGTRAAAAAKSKTEGGAAEIGYNVAPGIHVFQMTEEGALVGLSITGAKYWRNDDLN
jgi:lipid-binding SYLF domain-containing protein